MNPRSIDKLSRCVVQVTQYGRMNDGSRKEIGIATAFIILHKSVHFLVTNHHVVSGYRLGTKQFAGTHSTVPVELQFEVYVKESEGPLSYKYDFRIDIERGAGESWLEHPVLNNNCDVVAIPLSSTFETNQLNDCKIKLENEDWSLDSLRVMDQLFVVGYPMPIKKLLSDFPIYKAATVASEPFGSELGTQFYADTKTKPGMSGSLVIKHERLAVESFGQSSLTLSDGRRTLIGVYSGRAENAKDAYEAELGLIWPIQDFLMPILDLESATQVKPKMQSRLQHQSWESEEIGWEVCPPRTTN